jgi:hypothetical protein
MDEICDQTIAACPQCCSMCCSQIMTQFCGSIGADQWGNMFAVDGTLCALW